MPNTHTPSKSRANGGAQSPAGQGFAGRCTPAVLVVSSAQH